MIAAALGFRVKSGWAAAILLQRDAGRSARPPRIAERRVIDLCDPAVPESRQPYHEVMDAPTARRAAVERRLLRIVERSTGASVRGLLRRCRAAGLRIRGAGLVVGSVIDPATIGNEHIRAHALEGQLFRTALERALRAEGLSCVTLLEREVYDAGAARLGRPPARLKRAVTALGVAVDGPWRADEKTATVAAWMVL